MWLYGVVFLSALTVDVIPLIAPSAWMVALFLLVKLLPRHFQWISNRGP
jgi:hypothetical protein